MLVADVRQAEIPPKPRACDQETSLFLVKVLLSRLAGQLAKMFLSHFVRWILSLPSDTRYD